MFFRKDLRRGDYPSLIRPRRTRSANVSGNRRRAFEHLEDRRVLAVDFASVITGGSSIADINISDTISALVVDGDGNTIVVGKFAGTVDFDPGAGTYELTSSPATARNNFLAKYDASNNLLWARAFGGDTSGAGGLSEGDREIAIDSVGNVFVAGTFAGTADFGSTSLISSGSTDAFLTKLDSGGNFLWAKQFGGVNVDYGSGVDVDGTGNAMLAATSYTSHRRLKFTRWNRGAFHLVENELLTTLATVNVIETLCGRCADDYDILISGPLPATLRGQSSVTADPPDDIRYEA